MSQSVVITLILAGAILLSAYIIFPKLNNSTKTNNWNNSNFPKSSIKKVDGGETQILEITARGGYEPSTIEAKANVNTILRVKTLNTFDCSAAFSIPKYDISKILPNNGVTDFEIGSHASGERLDAMCSMGMYRLTINFK